MGDPGVVSAEWPSAWSENSRRACICIAQSTCSYGNPEGQIELLSTFDVEKAHEVRARPRIPVRLRGRDRRRPRGLSGQAVDSKSLQIAEPVRTQNGSSQQHSGMLCFCAHLGKPLLPLEVTRQSLFFSVYGE